MVKDGENERYAREFQFEVAGGLVQNINEIKNGAKLRLKNLFWQYKQFAAHTYYI